MNAQHALLLASMNVTEFRKFRDAYMILLRASVAPDVAIAVLCDAHESRMVRRHESSAVMLRMK